jgi:DNA polymerase kappa
MTTTETTAESTVPNGQALESEESTALGEKLESDESKTLKYHLLGPSLTKAGQDKVDQSKVRSRL